jgi:hypothetical protein
MKFAVYLEGTKEKAGCIAVRSRQYNPPVCHELACRSISRIIPHYRLILSSCLTHDLVKMELGIAYYLNAYPAVSCAAYNQHAHLTSCSIPGSLVTAGS